MGSRDMVQTMVWGRCSLQAMDGSGEMAPVAKMLNHIAGKYCKYCWQCYASDTNIAGSTLLCITYKYTYIQCYAPVK